MRPKKDGTPLFTAEQIPANRLNSPANINTNWMDEAFSYR